MQPESKTGFNCVKGRKKSHFRKKCFPESVEFSWNYGKTFLWAFCENEKVYRNFTGKGEYFVAFWGQLLYIINVKGYWKKEYLGVISFDKRQPKAF